MTTVPHATPLQALRRPAALRPLAWLLVAALCLASTLGLLHRTVHLPGVAHATALAASNATPEPAAAAAHAHAHGGALHGLLALFGGHDDGDLQCRLYDQLAHGSALPSVALLVLPVVLPTAVFDFMQGEALARWVLLFDARGPPAAR
ncbi:MAG: hypothetical protein AAGD03_06375 [Bordetella sp.]|nr:hypothetical protein [Pseudomonadota bacterium]MDQ8016574.1 hypothetical protein [Pseudomonadota bacterium]